MTEDDQITKIRSALRKDKWQSIAKISKEAKVSRITASKYLGVLKARGEVELDASEKPYKKYRLKSN